MRLILITIITFVITFLLNPLSKKTAKRVNADRFTRVHIHHSTFGAIIFIVGAVISNTLVMGLGLGMYLGHVAEEVYFNKRNPVIAFLIFVTR